MQDKNYQFEYLMSNHLSGNITDDEERVLIDILNSDPNYKVLYREMAKTRAISFIPVLEKEKESNYESFIHSLNKNLVLNVRSNFLRPLIKIAAVVLFILSTSISSYYIYTNNFNGTNKTANCETIVPLGSQAKLILPDGTVAWLNSGSILKYSNSYGDKNREVLLTGEGYFEVTKDKNKPFLVHTNNIEIKVLGTVFNVRSYLDDPTVEVNLLEGKVDVAMLNGSSKKITLIPNEKAVYNKCTGKMYSYKTNAGKSAQWTVGRICFVDASLKDIVKDLERKYDVQIKLETADIREEVFSGSLNLKQSLSEILDYIDVDKKFTRTYNGKTIIINRRNS